MAGFVRATRNGQFNESAQKLVNEAINHYQGLRESLSRMTGKRGYEAYFESWTPPLMEDDTDTSNLNELFVQETLDPRIESVMPILSKLQKNLGEMKEVNALAEWADSLLEGGDGGEASEEEDGDTAGDAGEGGAEDAPADDLTEEESLTSNNPIGIPEGMLDTVKKVGSKVFDKLGGGSEEDLLKDLQKKAGIPARAQHGKPNMAKPKDEEVDEGVIGNMFNKAKGMFTKPGQPAAAPAPGAPATPAPVVPNAATQARIAAAPQGYDPNTGKPQVAAQAAPGAVQKGGTMDMTKKVTPAAKPAAAPAPAQSDYSPQELAQINKDLAAMNDIELNKAAVRTNLDPTVTAAVKAEVARRKGVAEDLDANQKRVGQLGPTEKVKNNNIGKLVGANENFINTDVQAVTTEGQDDLDTIKRLLGK
jgi:hypothetical protein